MSIIQNVYQKIIFFFLQGSKRSIIIKKNIFQSLFLKIVSIILSLLIVPLTINYVKAEQYGIWLTISSIVGWISYFDIGLGNGLRNKYAEAKANKDYKLASRYISTTYAIFAMLFFGLFILFIFINNFIDWTSFLNIDILSNFTIRRLMTILIGFFCLKMLFNVLNSILLGDQKTAFVSGIVVAEQILSLTIIFILSKFTESSLINLALAYSGIPCLVLLIVSIYVFKFSKNNKYSLDTPSFKNIDFSLTSKLLSLGGKFFLIQISILIIFQCVNIILSRNIGQMSVTQYNVTFKYFQIIYMINVIVFTPFWSAFTDAYTKSDFKWMQSSFFKIKKITLLNIPLCAILLLFSPWFFKIWLGDSVTIPFTLSLSMGLYILAMSYAGLHMHILNGLGKVNLQFYIYLLLALIAIPSMDFLSKYLGITGILIFLIIVYLTQGFFGSIQIKKILSNNASGLWNK